MDRISRHGARVILTAIATSLVLFGSFTTIPAASAAAGDPTIVSDQPDYAAGSLVTLTGSAWIGDSSVHINVDDSLGKTWSRDVDVPVAADGAITDSFTLPSNFVATYAVTATGNDSQRQATTNFTDAAISVGTTQGETATAGVPSGSYTGGNIVSYRELDRINFRFTLTNSDAAARAGNVTIEYDDVGSGCSPVGFFLAPFNIGTWNGSHPGVESISGSVPSATTVGAPTVNGTNWNQVVHFAFSNAGSARIYFYLQLSGDAGQCNGSSTHVGFSSGSQTGDVGSPGTQSWPVPARNIIQLGDVTVIKNIDRNGDGTFESTANADEYKFCMANYPTTGTTTCQNTDSSGETVFTNVIDGAHDITETQLDTTLGTYAFVSGSGTGVNGGTCTFSGSTATATVIGDTTSPDSATCTFNNGVVKGSIELKKVWTGTAGQTTLQIGTADGGAQKASQLTGASGAAPLTTGPVNVNPGTFYLSETGGLGNYTASAFTCFNDNGVGTGGIANNGIQDGTEANVTVTPTAGGGSVHVASNAVVVCSVTNTRNTGTIEVIKDFVGTAGKVNLQVDGTTKLADAGDGDTTGAIGVDTGNHSVGETAGTGTSLSDYTSSIVCKKGTTTVASGTGTSLGSIPVGNNDAIVCTITNTRNTGTIEVIKDFVGTAGKVNLQVDGTTKLADAGDGDTTGAIGVDTGNHSVGETAGTGTSLSDYTSSIVCKKGTTTVASGTGTSLSGIAVATGDAIVCTITNTRKQGTIEVIKDFVGTAGKVNLQVDGTTKLADAGDGDTTGAIGVDTGNHSVGETAGTGTSLSDYTSSIVCKKGTTTVASGTGTSLGSIPVGNNDAIVCTITNTRNTGTIEVIKDFVGTAGKVNLQVDGTTKLADAGDGDTTGAIGVDTGNHSVGETAGTGTSLSDYTSSIVCKKGTTTVASGTGTSLSGIAVATGDAIVCTITNTRKQGTIEVIKDFVGTAGKVNLSVDGTDKATNVGDGGTTGAVTVDTGNHTVGETAGTGTDLGNYTSSIICRDAGNNVVAGGNGSTLGSIPVGLGDAIVCTITNTRKQGTIEVVKDFVGTAGKVNLSVDGTDKATNVGDGGTTGAVTVDTGNHTVGETAGTGTNLSNYNSSVSCVNAANTVVASGSGTSLGSIPVGETDAIVCTITNTRKQGTIEVVKDFVGTAGKVNLSVDGTDKATNVGDGGTTGAVTVDTGNHTVGETAGTGTNLSNYNSSVSCVNAANTVVASGSGTSLGSIPVGETDAIVCTITNTRKQGTIEVVKDFVGTAGKVNLSVDGTDKATNVGDGGTTGAVTVDTGNHTVGETAGTGTNLSNYNSSVSCVNAANTVVASGSGTSLGSIPVGETDAIVCTITNTRKQGTIEVVKDFVGTAGKVNLSVDGTDKATNVGDGGTTGAVTVDTGNHTVGETAGTGTNLSNYNSSVSCVNAANTVVASGSGTSLGSIPVGETDAIVCTITNTRKQGTIEVVKDFVGTAGKVNLSVDGTDKATNVGDGGTTGAVTVDTGNHTVGETAGTGTNLSNYNSSVSCVNAANTVVASGSGTSLGSIPVGETDAIVCTITNTRKQGTIEVVKDFVGTAGKVNLSVDGTDKATNVGDGGTTGAVTVDTGNHTVGETAGTGTNLSNYNSSVSCVNAANTVVASGSGTSLGSIPVGETDAIVCTITNTRKQGTIEVVKDFVGTAGKVNLSVDGTDKATNVGDGGTTGAVTVDTGNHTVGETAGTGTNLSNYNSSVSCVNAANTVVASGSGTSLGSIPVGETDAIVCTITNTRKQGTIEVVKDFVGTAGKVNLSVDGTDKATNVGDGGTTGAVTVDTGNHTVGETAGTGTNLSNYNSSVSCVNAANTVVASGSGTSLGSIPVGETDAIVCTITNTRKQGTIEVVKDFVGTAGKVNLSVDGTDKATNVGDGGTTGAVTVDTGNHTVGETAGTGTNLSNYNSSVSCVNAANTVVASGSGTSLGSIPVGETDAIVCTITNTRKTGTLNVYKYHDLNANGSKTDNEPYLSGWTFYLDLNNNKIQDAMEPSAVTGDGTGGTTLGLATFAGVDTGTYSVCEVLQADWFNSQPGSSTTPCQSVTITENTTSTKTFGNFQKVKIKVTKTVNGGPLGPNDSYTFTLRQGATTANASDGTILETVTINQANNPVTFSTALTPGTYQVCETVPPKVGTSIISTDWNGNGVVTYGDPSQGGDWFVPGLAPNSGSSDIENTIVCANITVKSGDGTVSITIDNHLPSLARTIGYWKNWSSCDGKGKQAPILDQTLAAAVNAGKTIKLGSFPVTTCAVAVDILDKRYIGNASKVGDGAKAASNPAVNVAAQLLAYKLNIQLGASATCSAANAAAKNVDAYLTSLGYNGNTPTKVTDPKVAANLNYANGILDAYNNDTLNCSMVLNPPYPSIWI